MRRGRRAGTVAVLSLAFSALSAQAALATFHEMSVREVFPGSSSTSADAEYVELEMYAPGQNFVEGHTITVYNSVGTQVASAKFLAEVKNGANQATLVAATPAAESAFGITADVGLTPPGAIDPAGGAVCWESLDCVSWGSFGGSLPSPVGSAAAPAGIPDGMALRRTIAPGCATLLEPTDDHDNSAVDFSPVFPGPRPNPTPPSERPCGAGAGGAAGGGGAAVGNGAPATLLRRKPAKRGHDRTPTFRFAADEAGASFECKIDKRAFRPCASPFTARALAPGGHTFRVRARDDSGLADPSPATYAFVVLPRR
jgi:hypothetical protein